jgi:hypothetical protein
MAKLEIDASIKPTDEQKKRLREAAEALPPECTRVDIGPTGMSGGAGDWTVRVEGAGVSLPIFSVDTDVEEAIRYLQELKVRLQK